jgi:hypothetical protein
MVSDEEIRDLDIMYEGGALKSCTVESRLSDLNGT